MLSQDQPRLQHNGRYQKPERQETSSGPPLLRIHVPFLGESGGRQHSFSVPDLRVLEVKGRAARGCLWKIRDLSSGGYTAEKKS